MKFYPNRIRDHNSVWELKQQKAGFHHNGLAAFWGFDINAVELNVCVQNKYPNQTPEILKMNQEQKDAWKTCATLLLSMCMAYLHLNLENSKITKISSDRIYR